MSCAHALVYSIWTISSIPVCLLEIYHQIYIGECTKGSEVSGSRWTGEQQQQWATIDHTRYCAPPPHIYGGGILQFWLTSLIHCGPSPQLQLKTTSHIILLLMLLPLTTTILSQSIQLDLSLKLHSQKGESIGNID